MNTDKSIVNNGFSGAVRIWTALALLLAVCAALSCGRSAAPQDGPAANSGQDAVVTVMPSPTPAPTPAPTPTPTPEPTMEPGERLIGELLDSMTAEDKIGQLLMFGFAGRSGVPADFMELARKYRVGNVIFYGDNIDKDDGSGGFTGARLMVDALESGAPCAVPRIFSADVEGGAVVRFVWEPPIPSAYSLGKGSAEEARGLFRGAALKLREAGISLDLAPVFDISEDPLSTFMGKRMISSDLDTVSGIGSAIISGLHEGGCASCAKHFPGHGGTAADSHFGTPTVDKSRAELFDYDIAAFRSAVEAGTDCVMCAHILYPALDPENIATLSPAVITGVLRDELGFSGVVISDDMRMEGLGCEPAEAAVRFLLAGGDMILCGAGAGVQESIITSLYDSVRDGTISETRLDESVERVLRLKLALGLIG